MHVVTATETMGRWNFIIISIITIVISIIIILVIIIIIPRFGNGQGAEYAESYLLEYWRPRLGRWVRYRNIHNSEVTVNTVLMILIIMMNMILMPMTMVMIVLTTMMILKMMIL